MHQRWQRQRQQQQQQQGAALSRGQEEPCLDELPHGVTEVAVPLCPAASKVWKPSHLHQLPGQQPLVPHAPGQTPPHASMLASACSCLHLMCLHRNQVDCRRPIAWSHKVAHAGSDSRGRARVTRLVQAVAVPGLCNELGVPQQGVLADELHQGGHGQGGARRAACPICQPACSTMKQSAAAACDSGLRHALCRASCWRLATLGSPVRGGAVLLSIALYEYQHGAQLRGMLHGRSQTAAGPCLLKQEVWCGSPELLYIPCSLLRASSACCNPVHDPPTNESTDDDLTAGLPVLPPASGALR